MKDTLDPPADFIDTFVGLLIGEHTQAESSLVEADLESIRTAAE